MKPVLAPQVVKNSLYFFVNTRQTSINYSLPTLILLFAALEPRNVLGDLCLEHFDISRLVENACSIVR